MAPFCQEVPCMDQHISKWDTQSAVVQVGIWPWRQQKKQIVIWKGNEGCWFKLNCIDMYWLSNVYILLYLNGFQTTHIVSFHPQIPKFFLVSAVLSIRTSDKMTCKKFAGDFRWLAYIWKFKLERKANKRWYNSREKLVYRDTHVFHYYPLGQFHFPGFFSTAQFDQAAELPFERFQVLALAASILWWK